MLHAFIGAVAERRDAQDDQFAPPGVDIGIDEREAQIQIAWRAAAGLKQSPHKVGRKAVVLPAIGNAHALDAWNIDPHHGQT
jgi:hypothetical protein